MKPTQGRGEAAIFCFRQEPFQVVQEHTFPVRRKNREK